MSKTHHELFILAGLDGATLGQALDDGNRTVKLFLRGHRSVAVLGYLSTMGEEASEQERLSLGV